MNFIGSVTILFNLWPDIIQGIMADDNLKVHYRQKGATMCFTATVSPAQLTGRMSWKYGQTVIAESQKGVNPAYKMRVDYNSTVHTLCIRELDKTNQGDYVAVYENWTEVQMAKHRLIVENAVPAVDIKITRLSSEGPPGLCNVAVNCTVQYDWASFICDKHYCTRSQQVSSTKVNITVSNDNRTIICAGNNHVSTKTKSASTEGICFSENDSNHMASTVPLAIFAGVICLCFLIYFLIWGIRKYRVSTEKTLQQAHLQSTSSHPPQVNTVYEEVEQSQRCQADDAVQTSQETNKSKESLQAQSVYSVLQLPARVNPSDSDAETASPGK